MKKFAKEKLKSKNIKWVEAYTDKTAFLKEQYEDVVGPYSYFRFEGRSPDGDEYYCILSPARVHQPIAKWFAGVRKLPATYSAGGKYFDSLDSAAAYALETWGVPTPRKLRPYSTVHLKGISSKIKRWKAAREENSLEHVGENKDSKYEIKKQASRLPSKTNRRLADAIVNVYSEEDVAEFKNEFPNIANFLIEEAKKLREKKIEQFVKSVGNVVSPELVEQNTETFVIYWKEDGGYICNVGPYVGKYRKSDVEREQTGIRHGIFERRFRIISPEFLEKEISLIVDNAAATTTKAFVDIFSPFVGSDSKVLKEFRLWMKNNPRIASNIEIINSAIEKSTLNKKQLYQLDENPENRILGKDDFRYVISDGDAETSYAIDDPTFNEKLVLDSKKSRLELSFQGYKKVANMSSEFKKYLNLKQIMDDKYKVDISQYGKLDASKVSIPVQNINIEIMSNYSAAISSASTVAELTAVQEIYSNIRLNYENLGKVESSTNAIDFLKKYENRPIHYLVALAKILNISKSKDLNKIKNLTEEIRKVDLNIPNPRTNSEELESKFYKSVKEASKRGIDGALRETSLLDQKNYNQVAINFVKVVVSDYISKGITEKRQDFYFNINNFIEKIKSEIANQKDLPSQSRDYVLNEVIDRGNLDDIIKEEMKIYKKILSDAKKQNTPETLIPAIIHDRHNQARKKYESRLGYETLDEAVEAMKNLSIPADRLSNIRGVTIPVEDVSFTRVNKSNLEIEEKIRQETGYSERSSEKERKIKGLEPDAKHYDVSKISLEELTDVQLEDEIEKYKLGDLSFYNKLDDDDKEAFRGQIREDIEDELIKFEDLEDDKFEELLIAYRNKESAILSKLTGDQKMALDYYIKFLDQENVSSGMDGEAKINEDKNIEEMVKAKNELSATLIKESCAKNMNIAKTLLAKSGKTISAKKINKIIKGL